MIVFEYMNKGTLRQFLDHMKANNFADFPWKRRIHMALGGALGLYRIHNMQPPMLHCAIGSDKFLVNSNWEIKVGIHRRKCELTPYQTSIMSSVHTEPFFP